MFRLLHPFFLLCLALLPLIAYLEIVRPKRGLRFSSVSLLRNLPQKRALSMRFVPLALRLLAGAALIVGLARPQLFNLRTEITSYGVDIALAIDTSGSMRAMDFKIGGERVDRLTVVQKVVADFIRHRKSDRIGMIVFGDIAFTQSPLTLDYDVLLAFLDQIEIGMAGEATAIGDAIALAVKRLKDLPSKSKIIILLTDGRSNAGRIPPEQAAQIAKSLGIKIYTIGIGTAGPVPFPVQTIFGTRLVPQQMDIDEETLKKIASLTGAQFFNANDTEGLKKIYETIDQLEKSEAKSKQFEEVRELYSYFVLAGIALLILEFLLREIVWKRLTD